MGIMKEITIEELRGMPKNSYMLIDIRDEGLVSYGTIPGAVNFPLSHAIENVYKGQAVKGLPAVHETGCQPDRNDGGACGQKRSEH